MGEVVLYAAGHAPIMPKPLRPEPVPTRTADGRGRLGETSGMSWDGSVEYVVGLDRSGGGRATVRFSVSQLG